MMQINVTPQNDCLNLRNAMVLSTVLLALYDVDNTTVILALAPKDM